MQTQLNTENLKQARENAGLSKAEAARRLQLSSIGYCRYEYGVRTPSIQTIEAIANCFNTSVDFLQGKTTNMSPDTILIKKKENPELFELVKELSSSEESQIKRLWSYYKKLVSKQE